MCMARPMMWSTLLPRGGQAGVAAIMEGWRKRNGCSDNPAVIKPYPTNKPSSGATMTHWTGGECGSEIVMISLPGKGHWHSNDDNGVNTTREFGILSANIPPNVVN